MDHKTSLKSLGYICSNSQKKHCMGQHYTFFFYANNHYDIKKGSCSMKIFSKFPSINISKLNYWLVIYIAKNLILTILKAFLDCFAPSDSRFSNSCISAKYHHIITLMERLCIQLSDDVYFWLKWQLGLGVLGYMVTFFRNKQFFFVNVRDVRFISCCSEITRRLTKCSKR